MSECGSACRGLDETIFQTPTLLRMTLGTLALMDDYERQKASNLLHQTVEQLNIKDLYSIQVRNYVILKCKFSFIYHCIAGINIGVVYNESIKH